MKPRLVLTVIWLCALGVALAIAESYQHTTTAEGIPMLFPADRAPIIEQLSYLFGPYLAGILGFWYTEPFAPQSTDAGERFRFVLALGCTCMLLVVVLYFVVYTHLFGPDGGTVASNVTTGVKFAGVLSFLVAPVNFYYFGMKSK